MEQKTKVHAPDGTQNVIITREFDLPVELLFKAHTDAGIIEQWMGNTVLKFDAQRHGSYEFEKKDDKGTIVFKANGTIHTLIANEKMVRTFEMDYAPFGVQLETYLFERLTDDTSKLTMNVVYQSAEVRGEVLKMPFVQGINWAHKRMEEVVSKLK